MTQISCDIIKDLVAEEEVSDNELEILALALDGKSPAEIKTILGRQSENAVQKTLSRIYTKFRISGAGPGKLLKLQKIISDRLQVKQGKRKVLIAWAGSNGKYQAEKIRDAIFKHPLIEAIILDIDGSSESVWLQTNEQLISGIDFGILCLPQECFENTSIIFLVGFLSAKLQNFKLLRFSKKVTFENPIHLPVIDGIQKENLAYLLHEIIGGDIEEAKDWINYKLSTSNWLNELLEKELNYSYQDELFKSPSDLLKDLQKVRNSLKHLNNKDEVIKEALRLVRERLNSQTASIFLFSKDGRLHRQKIVGVDTNGHEIDDTWFEDENYLPGESFTGKAALPEEDDFGRPQSANNLNEKPLETKSKKKYSEKLGGIYAAIAVPLDGQHKTYGVLEVINKFDPFKRRIIPNSGFSQEEIHWLSAIGSSVASALSNLRKKRQAKLIADLSDFLVGCPNDPSDIKDAYKNVVKRLISDDTVFEVCILRVKNENGYLKVEYKDRVDRVNWDKRLDEPRSNKDGLVGDTIRIKDAVIVTGINEQNIKQFKNQDWIALNQFKSFGCFPLIYKEEVVGTLSLYTGFEYDFHPGCREFLKRVASLVAAFIGREKESKVAKSVAQHLHNCYKQPIDLSQLENDELREQIGEQCDTMRSAGQTLDVTFGNRPESNNVESSSETSPEIVTKYCS